MFWSHTIALHEEQNLNLKSTATRLLSVRTWEADQSNSNEWQNYLIHSKCSTQKNDSFMNQASLLLSNYCITSEDLDFSAWVIWTTFMILSWCFSVHFVLSLFIVISLAREKYSIFFLFHGSMTASKWWQFSFKYFSHQLSNNEALTIQQTSKDIIWHRHVLTNSGWEHALT